MKSTEILSTFIADTSITDLPESVIVSAKTSVLDSLGCGLAGAKLESEALAPVLRVVKSLGGTEESTIIADGYKTNELFAAFANGCFIHSIDFDDTHQAALTHTSAAIVPAALALGEKINASGKDVILAIALGFEAATKVGQSVMPDMMRFWHSTGMNGTIGGAATAGKLLGLTAEKMNLALGVAADFASGSIACIEFGDITKSLHAGTAAMNGILSALLVEEGAGGPRNMFDYTKGYCYAYSTEPKIEKISENLGNSFEILVNGYKAFPSILASHTSIKAVMDIVAHEQLEPDKIESISVKTYNKVEEAFCNYDPQTLLAARLSVPFCIALAAIDGEVTLNNFTEKRVHDSNIRDLMKKITVKGEPELDALYPEKFPARVTIRTTEGKEILQDEYYPKGSYKNPFTREEIEDKFMGLAINSLSKSRAQAVIDSVSRLESLESITGLTGTLY